MAVFLVMPGKPSFRHLDFNVGLWYRKSSFREETLRCQLVKKHLDIDLKRLSPAQTKKQFYATSTVSAAYSSHTGFWEASESLTGFGNLLQYGTLFHPSAVLYKVLFTAISMDLIYYDKLR